MKRKGIKPNRFVQNNRRQVISEKKVSAIVICLLAAMFFQAFLSMRLKTLTFDETVHLTAGYSYLKTGDYRLNLEQPPLMKILAAIPLLCMDLHLPLYSDYWKNNSQYLFAKHFLYYSGNDAEKITFWGRLPMLMLAVLLGLFIFTWSKRLYGVEAGLFSLFFFVFCPNMLAFSRLIVMDFGLACFMLIACYQAWNYLEEPSTFGLILTGLFTAFALVSKFSAIMLIPIFFLMVCWKIFGNEDTAIEFFPGRKKVCFIDKVLFLFTRFAVIAVVVVIAIYAVYGFRGDALALYKKGVEMIYFNQVQSYKFYMNGKFSSEPWWYYHLFAFFVKTPVPALIIILFSALFLFKRTYRLYNELWLLMPVFIIMFISCFDARNLGLRRILPVYPFLFVFAGKLLSGGGHWMFQAKKNAEIIILVMVCIWHMVSSLRIFPDYLTYFNGLVGGARNGIKYLDDSNIDWGQDLKGLKTYMEDNNILRVRLWYFGTADAKYYKINTLPVTEDDFIKGPVPNEYYAISIHFLNRLKQSIAEGRARIDWLKDHKPVHIIGNTIYIYRFG